MSTATIPTPARAIAPGADLSEILYEVVGGIIQEKPAMGSYEFDLANILMESITEIVRPRGLGRVWVEMLFDFRPIVDRQRRPDVAFISSDRWPMNRRAPRRPSAWRMVPDLAIEIISPPNLAGEVQAKIDEYFQVGVSRVWVVYPNSGRIHLYESPATIHVFGRGQVLTDEALFPGFGLDLDEFFGPPEPVDATTSDD